MSRFLWFTVYLLRSRAVLPSLSSSLTPLWKQAIIKQLPYTD